MPKRTKPTEEKLPLQINTYFRPTEEDFQKLLEEEPPEPPTKGVKKIKEFGLRSFYRSLRYPDGTTHIEDNRK